VEPERPAAALPDNKAASRTPKRKAGPELEREPTTLAHVVAKGETLSHLALRNGTTAAAIRKANGWTRDRTLRVGETLRIPAPARAALARSATKKEKALPAAQRGHVKLESPMGTFEGDVFDATGQISDAARDAFERVLACKRTGRHEPIHGRLIRLVAKVSQHFKGRKVHVVSGFRPWTPEQYTTESRHNFGRAVDFRVEGVANEEVRDFLRGFKGVGVGYYPNSSFVHLDVRDEPAYWVDYAGPGEPPRYAHARKPAANAEPSASGGTENSPAEGPADHNKAAVEARSPEEADLRAALVEELHRIPSSEEPPALETSPETPIPALLAAPRE
jgi:uncharacterized protein YcbK (DUF882 family)